MNTPKTISDWVSYISFEIPLEDLIHQARVAGSTPFIRLMTEEGYTGPDLAQIHQAFADRFVSEGVRVPSLMDECHIDYLALTNKQTEDEELLIK
jgi:hypothetical protein